MNMIDVGGSRYAARMASMGDRLRLARAVKYRSAAQAAEALGVAASTYRAHENGQNEFSPEEARHYGKKFGVSAAYLLTGEGLPVPDEDDDRIRGDAEILKMLARIDGLTEYDIGMAFSVIKNALESKRASQEQAASRDPQQPANRLRELAPSRRKAQLPSS